MCGDGRLEALRHAPASPHLRAVYVRFADGAHTKWHYHAGQQLLVGTQGTGFVEFRGLPDVMLQEGDRVIIPVRVWHRHGAAPGESLIHLAVTTGETVWDQDDPCDKRS
jgi:quercetin dioxygenase-like cupin family protein